MEKGIGAGAHFTVSYKDVLPFMIWIGVFFMTWLFMHGAEHYLRMTPDALGRYYDYRWFLIAHITAGGGALISGIVQFWPKLRNFSWKLHRVIGYLYLLAVLVSSLSALILASTTARSISWGYSFTLQIWASVWISATFIAWWTAFRRQFKLHREWMMRSYVVTVAFLVSGFALKIPYVQQLGSFEEVSVPMFWMGWAVPLYAYEIIRTGRSKGKK
ncbi:DUF2306 domain-containing protein [Chitinophaga caseinilytica]|uniref:DUF2306 domain-containing protein n=1 Tax=Chitinophaga caseinilytica TaxID=2267521 RepID=A0ABZ2YXT3_9BACT